MHILPPTNNTFIVILADLTKLIRLLSYCLQFCITICYIILLDSFYVNCFIDFQCSAVFCISI